MFATDKQIAFITSLTGQIGETLAARVTFDTLPTFRGNGSLSKRDASKLIDALLEARDYGWDTETDEFGFDYSDADFDDMYAALDC